MIGPVCPNCAAGEFATTTLQRSPGNDVVLVHCGGCGHIIGMAIEPTAYTRESPLPARLDTSPEQPLHVMSSDRSRELWL